MLLRVGEFGPDALVISLGVDTYKDDPISSFKLEASTTCE
jgi:acetoin utilization deacetylase AcuC-like enzyme